MMDAFELPRTLVQSLQRRAAQTPDQLALRFLAETAREHDCAIRVGVNCGSVDPVTRARHPDDDIAAMVDSALQHCGMLDESVTHKVGVS